MNARTVSQGNPQTALPRFDRKFIEDHNLIERYLENKLPFKGARDLENWCRAHPDYLDELKLAERTIASKSVTVRTVEWRSTGSATSMTSRARRRATAGGAPG